MIKNGVLGCHLGWMDEKVAVNNMISSIVIFGHSLWHSRQADPGDPVDLEFSASLYQ